MFSRGISQECVTSEHAVTLQQAPNRQEWTRGWIVDQQIETDLSMIWISVPQTFGQLYAGCGVGGQFLEFVPPYGLPVC
jgi:hypothetical protein